MSGISTPNLAREFDKVEAKNQQEAMLNASELLEELSNAFCEVANLAKTPTGKALAEMVSTLLGNYTTKATQIAKEQWASANYWRLYDLNKKYNL